MPYDEIPLVHVLNYYLADAFDASEATDVLEWLGDGKTLAELVGADVSQQFYAQRHEELAEFIHYIGLDLIDSDGPNAITLTVRNQGELVLRPGNAAGTPWILTEHFQRTRAEVTA
ncbi:MAG: hypothetical protein WAQ27_02390 [Candidatus Microsaccharimonas sp.]